MCAFRPGRAATSRSSNAGAGRYRPGSSDPRRLALSQVEPPADIDEHGAGGTPRASKCLGCGRLHAMKAESEHQPCALRDYVSGIGRRPAGVTAYIHGPTGCASTMTAMSGQWCCKRVRLSEVAWLAVPVSTKRAPDARPTSPVRRAGSGCACRGDHHQTLRTDDGQPLVVEAAPRDLR